jgi:hypothetical protein
MLKAIEYRTHAQECRALARNMQNEQDRQQLLKMAEAWESFAADRERSDPSSPRLEVPKQVSEGTRDAEGTKLD